MFDEMTYYEMLKNLPYFWNAENPRSILAWQI